MRSYTRPHDRVGSGEWIFALPLGRAVAHLEEHLAPMLTAAGRA